MYAPSYKAFCCRVHKADGHSFAVKVIQLDKTREDRSQIKTLGEVNHPGIIKLVDWFETPATCVLQPFSKCKDVLPDLVK